MSVERYDTPILAALAGGVLYAMRRYSVTSYRPNPWTAEALLNVLTRAPYMEAARQAVNGKFNSVYRSGRVNEIVGGVKPQPGRKGSRHLYGLAVDIHPRAPYTAETASRKIWQMALGGDLGRIHKVIWEPNWVHVSWRAIHEDPIRLAFLKKTDTGFQTLEREATA